MNDVTELVGRFALRRKLGQGGMGVVYEALDRSRDALVALKTLPNFHPLALYRFKREFRTLANLAHPALIPLYEFISDGSTWFFTMELIEGVDFLTYVRAPAPGPAAAADVLTAIDAPLPATPPPTPPAPARTVFDPDRLRASLAQLAGGVARLHAEGILHRDLKPSNVLVRHDGRVAILDFGLVKEVKVSNHGDETMMPEGGAEALHQTLGSNWATLNTHRRIVGSIPYMAPEQAAGEALSEAADWYAVGVMLYEALSGTRPFVGDSNEVLMQKLTREAPPIAPLSVTGAEDLVALCEALLLRDPYRRPSGSAILRLLSPDDLPSRRDTSRSVPLVGRDRHLAKMSTALAAVEAGKTVAVHVRGASGCGKSALVHRFLAGIESQSGVLTLSGRCYEQESVPFKALDSLVDALCGHLTRMPVADARAVMPRDVASLARVFPVLQQVTAVEEMMRGRPELPDPQEVRRRAFRALTELLQRLGDRCRLVLHIDDLQWGDLDSATLLTSVLTSPEPPRMLFIAASRSDDEAVASPCLAALLELGRQPPPTLEWDTLEVAPLDFEEARQLAELLSPAGAAIDTAHVARESGGSPYFIQELATHAGADAVVAGDLDAVLWSRVCRLPLAAQRLLQIVALSGKPLPLLNATAAADVGAEAQQALGTLRAERLVRVTGAELTDHVETYHDRIRESVTAHMPSADVPGQHLRLAQSLSSSASPDVEAIATHFHRAGALEPAARHYVLAGDRAAAGLAFERAAALFGLAVGLPGWSDDERRQLHARRADALASSGRGVHAAAEYLAACEGAAPELQVTFRRQAGYQFCISGHIDEGREAFRTVLASQGLRLPRTRRGALVSMVGQRVRLLARGTRFRERAASEIPPADLDRIDVTWSVAGGITMIDPIRGAGFQTRNLLDALAVGEPYRVARALAWEAAHLSMSTIRLRRPVERMLGGAGELAERLGEPHAQAMVKLSRGVTAFFFGDHAQCLLFCDEAAHIFSEQCTGASWELDTCHAFALWGLYYTGRFRELSDRFDGLVAQARQRGAQLAEADLTTFGGLFAWLARDDPDGALHAVRSVMAHWSNQDYQVQHYTQVTAEAQIALYRGDAAQALQLVDDHWPRVRGAMLLQVEIVRIYLLHLRARCALMAAQTARDPRAMLERARRDARRLGRQAPPYARPLAQLIEGDLLADADPARAAALFTEAADSLDRQGWGGFGVSARRRAGLLLGGEAGRAAVAAVDAGLIAQGIRDPARFTAVQVPGCRLGPDERAWSR